MGSTDNFLPGTVLSPVASAAAAVPAIGLVEVAKIVAAAAKAEDVPPCLKLVPTEVATEDGTEDVDDNTGEGEGRTDDVKVGTDDVEVGTDDVKVGADDEEVEIADEEAATSVEEVDTADDE